MSDIRTDAAKDRSEDLGPAVTTSGRSPSTQSGALQGSSTTAGLTDSARDQAGAVWSDAKQKAREGLDQQQKSAAAGIGDFAGALHTAADQLDSNQSATAAQFTHHAADGLERLAGKLRNKDATALIGEIESFARQQPAVFLGAAVAAGFLAMRFMKSSSSHHAPESHNLPAYDSALSRSSANSKPAEGESHGHSDIGQNHTDR